MLLYCRAGFESECAAEITRAAAAQGVTGYCEAPPRAGFVVFRALPAPRRPLPETLEWVRLIFARQLLALAAEVRALPAADRATPLGVAIAGLGRQFSDLWLEYPDSNDGRALSRFCRAFRAPLRQALTRAGVRLDVPGTPRLHVFFPDSGQALIGLADPGNSAPWPLAIPRLRLPRSAPSRSALKLDEALLSFLDSEQRGRLLRPGMRAVDLGAAPGGWSWQLARRGLEVVAVDNGPLDAALLAGGLVTHVRADGFRYRPPRPVDWMVCDMVEQPQRIAQLVGRWLRRGDCRAAVFNLKLPMKRRYAAVSDALDRLAPELARPDGAVRLLCKQLYHDREEVTAAVLPG